MILYHFTSTALISLVRSSGLTKGALPWNFDRDGNPEMKQGFQWLTSDSDWFAQSWCMMSALPISRNAYRLTIQIPPNAERRIFKWSELVRRCQPDSAEILNKFGGDTSKWFIFAGAIPPSWIIAIERNPFETMRPDGNAIAV
jgi:hypothetical protein